MQQKSVSVVIPIYNGLALLRDQLPQVMKCLRSGDEIVIADDSNRDENAQWLKKTFDMKASSNSSEYRSWQATHKTGSKSLDIKVVLNNQNLRFAANANRGVAVATRPLIFLINSDVAPHPDALTFLLPYFDDEKMFAVGCHEIEKNSGGISGGKNKLWFERGLFVHSRADDFVSGETGWASGGSALFDKTKWESLGGFDEAYYPAYWEDIDLSYRAKKQGWKVCFERMAVVDHNHETTNTSVFGQQQMRQMSFKNALVFVWRNASLQQKFQHLAWLPYHLIVTNHKTQGEFNRGFVAFVLQLLHR